MGKILIPNYTVRKKKQRPMSDQEAKFLSQYDPDKGPPREKAYTPMGVSKETLQRQLRMHLYNRLRLKLGLQPVTRLPKPLYNL